MPRMILKNAKLLFPLGYDRPPMDIVIHDGRIEAVGAHTREAADEVIDLQGNVVSPGFVDLHLHPDTACLLDDYTERPRAEACRAQNRLLEERYGNWSEAEVMQDMLDRGRRMLTKSLRAGVLFARCHITFSQKWGAPAMEAYEALKAEFRDRMTLQNVVPYWKSADALWRKYAQEGRIDVIGGYPAFHEDGSPAGAYSQNLHELLALSAAYELPLDLHMESVTGDGWQMLYDLAAVMNGRKEVSLYEKVACSHLAAAGDPRLCIDKLLELSAICGKVYLSTVALPSNDMISAGTKVSRGAFPFAQMWDSGANVCIATGDVRNALYPFGNGDILSELLTAAQIHKRGTRMELRRMFETITWNPARAMHLKDYGILPGNTADLIVLDAKSIENALIDQPKRLLIMKRGKVLVDQLQGGTEHV